MKTAEIYTQCTPRMWVGRQKGVLTSQSCKRNCLPLKSKNMFRSTEYFRDEG